MANYHDELANAMAFIAERPDAIFLGQGVGVPGTTMSSTFAHVPQRKLLEFPVAEDLQMGTAIGMALAGALPVCVFPRWNFLICAFNQLVNHLDRLPLYSDGGYVPKVIIRTAVPSNRPFDPGPQHDDDFTEPLRLICRTIIIETLPSVGHIMPAYERALAHDGSTLLIEYTEHYKNERAKDDYAAREVEHSA